MGRVVVDIKLCECCYQMVIDFDGRWLHLTPDCPVLLPGMEPGTP